MGSHLCDALVQAGHRVRIFEKEHVSKDNISHLLSKIEWIEGDFSNAKHLRDAVNGIDVIFHLIGTTLPKSSNENPVYDISSNIVPTVNLLEVARKGGIKKIIFFSSGGTVYGIPRSGPIPEDHPTNPICAYGIQKLAIEKYLQLYHHLYGLDYTILRIANPYGQRQNPVGAQGAVAVFINKALKKQPIEIWGDGSVTRDYIYVLDVISAVLAAFEYQGRYKLFNIGSGAGLTLLDIVKSIEKIIGYKLDIQFKSSRALDVPVNVLDINRAQKELQWRPKMPFAAGLKKSIDYFSGK